MIRVERSKGNIWKNEKTSALITQQLSHTLSSPRFPIYRLRTRLSQNHHLSFCSAALINIINLHLLNCLLVRSHYQNRFDCERSCRVQSLDHHSSIASPLCIFTYHHTYVCVCFIHFHFTRMCDALQIRNRPKTFFYFSFTFTSHSLEKEGEFNSMCSTKRFVSHLLFIYSSSFTRAFAMHLSLIDTSMEHDYKSKCECQIRAALLVMHSRL